MITLEELFPLFFQALLWGSVFMVGLWLFSMILKNAGIIDVVWSLLIFGPVLLYYNALDFHMSRMQYILSVLRYGRFVWPHIFSSAVYVRGGKSRAMRSYEQNGEKQRHLEC